MLKLHWSVNCLSFSLLEDDKITTSRYIQITTLSSFITIFRAYAWNYELQLIGEEKKISFYYFILILVPRKFWSIFDEEEDNLWLNGAILELLQVTIMDKRTFQYVRLEQQSSNFYLHCETLLQLLFKSSFVGSVLWVKSMQLVKKSQLYYLPFKFSCILLKFCIGMSSGWDDEVSWGKVLFSVVQEKIILLILYLWHILLEYEWWLI